jgi:hypothetical protein
MLLHRRQDRLKHYTETLLPLPLILGAEHRYP